MVNVVGPVSGTVAAPPESEVWVKLPSGDVSVQLVTFSVFQKISARAPSGTVDGTAQISTRGGIKVAVGVIACCKVDCGRAACVATGVCVSVPDA